MKNTIASILLIFLAGGGWRIKTNISRHCVLDCVDNPIPKASIEAWKNQWIPFHLPVRLGETLTDENGSFILKTEKRASFFVYSGYKIVFETHPKESETKCAK